MHLVWSFKYSGQKLTELREKETNPQLKLEILTFLSQQLIEQTCIKLNTQNNTINQLNLLTFTELYTQQLTYFPSVCGKFMKIDQTWSHKKTSIHFKELNSYKEYSLIIIKQIKWSLTQQINSKQLSVKSLHIWKLSYRIPDNPWIKKEITKEIRKYFKLNGKKNETSRFVGCC